MQTVLLWEKSFFYEFPQKIAWFSKIMMNLSYVFSEWHTYTVGPFVRNMLQFQGTNVDEAKVMIGSSGMKILPVDNLDEAARLAVKLSNIVGIARDAQLNVNFQLPI